MPRNNAKPLPSPEMLFVKPTIYPKTKKPFVIRNPKTMKVIPPYGARVEDSIDIQRHLLDKTLVPAKEADVKAGAESARKKAAADAEASDKEAKAQADKDAAEAKKKAEEEAKAAAEAEAEAAKKQADKDAAKKKTTPGNS